MAINKLTYLLPTLGLLAACSPQTYTPKDSVVIGAGKKSAAETVSVTPVPVAVERPLVGMMPKATAFKMSGDYADNVAITIGPDGNISYYPAPSDISKSSAPTNLGNGWWLNNQGIGYGSVFTKFTYDEYSKLPSAPSPKELLDAVIPGARVVEMVQLPFTVGEARNNVAEIKEYIKTL